jgi:hypothetical protein
MLKGKKTYLAAAGLLALAGFKVYVGDLAGAFQSFVEALGLIGLRSAVSTP